MAARLLSRHLRDDGLEAALDAAGPPIPQLLTSITAALTEAVAGAEGVRVRLQALMLEIDRLPDDPLGLPRGLLSLLEGLEGALEEHLAGDPELVRLDAEISAALRRLGRAGDPELAETLAGLRAAEQGRLLALPGLASIKRAHGLLEKAIRRAALTQAGALLSGRSILVEAPARPPASMLRLAINHRQHESYGENSLVEFTLDYGTAGRAAVMLWSEAPSRLRVDITLGGAVPDLPEPDHLQRSLEASGLRANLRVRRQSRRPAALMPTTLDPSAGSGLDLRA